ncbi:MAG: hypothetical protein ABFD81_08140 [Syntrophaceae bacterium]
MQHKQKSSFFPLVLSTLIAALTLLALPGSAAAATDWNVGISGDSQGIEGFHFSIGEYYRVPEREVVVVHKHGIDEEELPVVFFLSQRAHVSPDVIVNMRLKHMSWMDITLHFGLSPEIYYVPVDAAHHPPQGKAYGYYRDHPRNTWKHMRMSDHAIVDQVNLQFLSKHYGYSPEHIIRYRGEGRNFVTIDRDMRREKKPQDKTKDVKQYQHKTDKNQGGHNNDKKIHTNDDDWETQKGQHR